MKVWKSMVPVLTLALTACSANHEQEADDERGSLSLALTGSASDGQTYRLRNAEFQITGYPDYPWGTGGSAGSGGGAGKAGGKGVPSLPYSEVVSSEADPDAAVITRRLIPGQYYVNFLSTDWYLERMTPTGPVQVEQAVFLSQSRTQYAYVWNGGATDVVYNFGVDGELIDFRSGDLNIRIEVERPEDNNQGSGGQGRGGSFPVGGWVTAGSPGVPSTGGQLGL